MRRIAILISILLITAVEGQAQTNDGLMSFLKNDDMKSAVSVMGINELMDSLNAFNLNDTIKGVMADFGYPIWYSWATGAKIPIIERDFNSVVKQPIASNKLRAYSWMLLIYLELDPRDSYVVFRTSENGIIYDYYCYKEEQHPNKFFKWAYCVKQPTEGYAELVQEMDDWLGIVKKHGIDYVRKNKIEPLKTITYEIVEKSLLAPGMDLQLRQGDPLANEHD